MGALQKVPTGLLGALGLKTLGSNPRELSDTASGIVDMLEMYLCTQQTSVQQELSQSWSNGQSLSVVVPSGVVWRVRAVGAELFLANASTISIDGLTVSLFASLPLAVYLATQHYPVSAAGALGGVGRFFTCGTSLGRPLLLLPGQSLGCQFDGNFVTAGATFARVRAIVEVIPL